MNKQPEFEVDFVIPWVNGSDYEWQKKKNSYQSNTSEGDSVQRFRDYGTLKYLLRSIEINANWVNKILLITDQQVPEWLADNVRILVIDHTDYIPKKYLPTFNSNVIELNIWRIKDLSEHFVLLNDDFLFSKETSKSDFFTQEGTPKDIAAQSVFMPRDEFAHIPINNISLINQTFNKREWLLQNWKTAFSFKYGVALNILSIMLSPLPYFTRFYEPHVGTSYLKGNFEKVWDLFPDKLDITSKNKFRDINEVSHWLVRYYQILTGQISTRSYKFGKYLSLSDDDILEKILKRKNINMLALNDNIDDTEKQLRAAHSIELLNGFFSEKSEFEK